MAKENTAPALETTNAASAATSPHVFDVDTWASDLIANIPALRETNNYNKFRAAIEELKSCI